MEIMDKHNSDAFKIVLIYFSATGNTKKVADVMEKYLTKLDTSATKINIMSFESRKEQLSLSKYDARRKFKHNRRIRFMYM